ncbi:hypothetical protein AB1Y20_007986 [Prymnesium parvum]|uniref:N-acetyltransferase domain-containing protein n=1 Tax=Prymnesium parvum TaxID=97485 RepID=A0AB34IVG5_PRYPA
MGASRLLLLAAAVLAPPRTLATRRPPTPGSSRRLLELQACAATGQWQRALRLFHSQVPPDEASRILAIRACARAEAWRPALSLLDAPAGIGAYNAAIAACGRAGAWQAALSVWRRAQTDGAAPSPTGVTITAAIAACGRAREWRAALTVLREAEGRRRPAASAYHAAARACERAGEWREALRLLEEMRGRGEYSQAARQLEERCRAEGRAYSHLSGLRRVRATGGGARARARNACWAIGRYTTPALPLAPGEAVAVGLQPDRAPARNCFKLVFFFEQPPHAKLGFLLLENSMGGRRSALRGLWIDESCRGRGLSKELVAIWLRLCLVAGLVPSTARINKPLIAHVLESSFGFVPEGGGVRVVVSDAVRRRDCLHDRSGSSSAHVATNFVAPSIAFLEQRVAAVLDDDGPSGSKLRIEPTVPALRRALVGKQAVVVKASPML